MNGPKVQLDYEPRGRDESVAPLRLLASLFCALCGTVMLTGMLGGLWSGGFPDEGPFEAAMFSMLAALASLFGAVPAIFGAHQWMLRWNLAVLYVAAVGFACAVLA